MALHAVWVHGTAARMQFRGGAGLEFSDHHRMDQVGHNAWTDVTGLIETGGASFRGQGDGQDTNLFHFSIPTPVIVPSQKLPAGERVRLNRIFVFFRAEASVEVIRVQAFDGPRELNVILGSPTGLSSVNDGLMGDPLAALVLGATAFDIQNQPEMFFGLGISVTVRFGRPGLITFTAAGADFFTS